MVSEPYVPGAAPGVTSMVKVASPRASSGNSFMTRAVSSRAAVTRRLPAVQPELATARLRLRALVAADAAAVVRLADDRAVSEFMLHMPHPYPPPAADDRYFFARADAGGVLFLPAL